MFESILIHAFHFPIIIGTRFPMWDAQRETRGGNKDKSQRRIRRKDTMRLCCSVGRRSTNDVAIFVGTE